MDSESSKLYVANLNFDVDEDQLRAYFEEYGLTVLSCWILRDKTSQRSKGSGFVELASEEDMMRAIEECDGMDLAGQPLDLSCAQSPREEEWEEAPRSNTRKASRPPKRRNEIDE